MGSQRARAPLDRVSRRLPALAALLRLLHERGRRHRDRRVRRAPHRSALAPWRRRGASVLVIPQPGQANHNGGQLQFGPDGLLFIGTGDGGGSGRQPRQRAPPQTSCSESSCESTPEEVVSERTRSPRATRSWAIAAPCRDLRLRIPKPVAILVRPLGPACWRSAMSGRPTGGGRLHRIRAAQGSQLRLAGARGKRDLRRPVGRTRTPTRPPRPFRSTPTRTRSAAQSSAATWSTTPICPSLDGRYLYADLCNGEHPEPGSKPGGASDDRDTGLTVRWPSSFGEGVGGGSTSPRAMGPVYRLKQGRLIASRA